MFLTPWLRAFDSSVASRSGKLRRRKPRRRRTAKKSWANTAAAVERLEDRTLLSVTATSVGNELLVSTDANDAITLTVTGGNVLVNGADPQTGPLSAATVEVIEVSAGDAGSLVDLSGLDPADFPAINKVTVRGGAGPDTIVGSGMNDRLLGGEGDDLISGGSGDDTINAGNGNDTLNGQRGHDKIVGGKGDDLLLGGGGKDTLLASGGNDRVRGQGGKDSLSGGPDNDLLEGANGADVLEGQHGDDTLEGNNGNDILRGGDGDDTLLGGEGNDRLFGDRGNDAMAGEDGDDHLNGRAGDDTLLGGCHNDSLFGGAGGDLLLGGGEDDSLNGQGGTDTLAGGSGSNILVDGPAETDESATFSAAWLPADDCPTPPPTEPVVLYRVNAGGSQLAGDPEWTADSTSQPAPWHDGLSETYSTSSGVNMSHASVPAGTPSSIFQSERYDTLDGSAFGWDFPVAPGEYEVRLYFAETWSGAFSSGVRKFDVSIEGNLVMDDYDVYAEVGANMGVMHSFTVDSDGNLDVDFTHVSQNPAVKAIEIIGGGGGGTPIANQAPQLAAIANQNVLENASHSFNVTANDPDGHAITLAAAGLPAFAGFVDNGNGTGTVNVNPAEGDAGSYPVTITAGDNGVPSLSDQQSFTLTVLDDGIEPGGGGFGEVVYRVNAGGSQLSGTPNWTEDSSGSPAPWHNDSGGVFSGSNGINMSHSSLPTGTPSSLFQSERYDVGGGSPMEWDFPVTPGRYEVRLYFAEVWSGAYSPGVRQFDVSIEGNLVLDNYDVYADVGANTGVMKSFMVDSDGNIDVDFAHVAQNPAIKGIEIVNTGSPDHLASTMANVDFGDVLLNLTMYETFHLVNTGNAGDPVITFDPADATLTGPNVNQFDVVFADTDPIVLAPGERTGVAIEYSATIGGPVSAALTIPHSGENTPLTVPIFGNGESDVPISFMKDSVSGTDLDSPTTLQWGPDDRLYVGQQDGLITIYDIVRNGPGDYSVANTEVITSVQNIPNHDDDGDVNPSVDERLVTGLLVTGTASNPVLYVTSSDPRIGAGPSGSDLNLDTNSGILSRLTWNGSSWVKVDLVRGLPRSEENHASNGMALDTATNTLFIAQGGNTNMGAPSNNFAYLPEFALSAAVLSVDLDAIGNSTYDLPTLDDEDRSGVNDFNDPFGGNDGKNQAILVPGGPVQVYSPGFRNPYDVVLTESGRMYSWDNGPNAGWGAQPKNEGPAGNATNQANEPGSTHGDGLHFITGPGYYAGHPNPTRSNPANTFNNSNPQSPVSVPNPVESDYRSPGSQNGALVVNSYSSNGLAEYTASNFANAMKGNLLVAGFNNTIKRVQLNGTGDAAVDDDTLFSSVGAVPLDVTTRGDDETFPGTIWVVDIATSQLIAFEPADFNEGGGNPDDLDNDGYLNDDETDNGTDPFNAADFPPDADGDFISNLNDPNDDNDALLDEDDPFAIDAFNGDATNIPVLYTWENDAPNAGGLFNMGFTGLMINGADNYEDLFDAGGLTAGGAAGVFTVDNAGPGTAHGGANSQDQAFQFGFDPSSHSGEFTGFSRVLGPFNGLTPQNGQQMGFYLGTGDQDNYVEIVLAGNSGGSVRVLSEVAGSDTLQAVDSSLDLPGPNYVDLFLKVNPAANTVQASYRIEGGDRTEVGPAISIPAGWLNNPMAVGLISTNPTGNDVPITWDFLGVVPEGDIPPDTDSAATVVIDAGSNMTSSTYSGGTFQVTNDSTDSNITAVEFDLSTAIFPDMVFDPTGNAGDTVAKGFTIDSHGGVGSVNHSYLGPHDGGFDVIRITFTDFDPGEKFTFSIDVDPTSITGVGAPGPGETGSVSGLELTGTTVTIEYDSGETQTTETYRKPNDLGGSQNLAPAGVATPAIDVVGLNTPTTTNDATQTIRVTGPAGAQVQLLIVEGGLFLAGVPNGGLDIDPFEANTALQVNEISTTVGAGGTVDIPVTLTRSNNEGGLNYIVAAFKESDGRTGPLSDVLVVELV